MDLPLHRKFVSLVMISLMLLSIAFVLQAPVKAQENQSTKKVDYKVSFNKVITRGGDRIWDAVVINDLIFTAQGKSNVVVYIYSQNGELFQLTSSQDAYDAPIVYGIDVQAFNDQTGALFEGIVYAAAGPDGILVLHVRIDLSLKTIIWTLSSHIEIQSGSAYDVYFDSKKDFLYAVLGSTPLAVYDVSDYTNPVLLSQWISEGIFQAERLAPFITENGDIHIIVAGGSGGILRFYYSTTSHALVKSAQGEEGSGFYMDVITFGFSIIAANGELGLSILKQETDTSFSIPKSPTNEINVDGYARRLSKVNETHFYSANVFGGFEMYSVKEDVNNPVEVGAYKGINASIVVDVHDKVFVGDWNGGFQILEVTKYIPTATTQGFFALDYNLYSFLVALVSILIVTPIIKKRRMNQ